MTSSAGGVCRVLGMANMQNRSPSSYGAGWHASRLAGALNSPARLVPQVMELLAPRTVVDIGCGPGTWLEGFMNAGVDDVMGVEGDWLDPGVLRIPRERLRLHDLTVPLELGRTFDLAVSLEVGEHLPETAARTLVATITKHAPVAMFSAAAPLQGGTHHVNERWPQYWSDLFAERGFVGVDVLRPRIWLDDEIAWYYRQNVFMAVQEDMLASLPPLAEAHRLSGGQVLPLVHPERFMRLAPTSPVRLKDAALGTIYERVPRVRQLREQLGRSRRGR